MTSVTDQPVTMAVGAHMSPDRHPDCRLFLLWRREGPRGAIGSDGGPTSGLGSDGRPERDANVPSLRRAEGRDDAYRSVRVLL